MSVFYLLIVCIAALFTPAYAVDSNGYAASVARVIDGDTIEVLHDKRLERIRLIGIDCPETSQQFGRDATQATTSLCLGKTVVVEAHATDNYGRIVANVLLLNGDPLSAELVELGFAWYHEQSRDNLYLQNLEATARAERLGLWAQPDPTPPWEWRHNHTISKLTPSQ
jgi:micrococcal nuclease